VMFIFTHTLMYISQLLDLRKASIDSDKTLALKNTRAASS
jgi:hypothetical protein